MKVLVRLYANSRDRRGLGDAVQLVIILKHLKKTHPNWEIYTETSSGKESCFTGFVKHTFNIEESPANPKDFEKVYNLFFGEPNKSTSELAVKYQVPATKTTTTLVEDFQIIPDPLLFKYDINISAQIHRIVKSYLSTIPSKNGIITIHPHAISTPHNKDIDDKDLSMICDSLIHNGYTPLILDWKDSDLPDQKRIFSPMRNNSIWMGQPHGNAGVIASIISQSKLFIGVDSGPLHVAGTTKTPTIGYWKFHHPIHFYDLSDNVTHMTPCEHLKYMYSDNKRLLDDYFQRNYKHRWYSGCRKTAIVDTIYETIGTNQTKNEIVKDEKIILPPFHSIRDRQWWPIKI